MEEAATLTRRYGDQTLWARRTDYSLLAGAQLGSEVADALYRMGHAAGRKSIRYKMRWVAHFFRATMMIFISSYWGCKFAEYLVAKLR